jgi:DNA-binding Lrp family transcriptional regulator
MALMSGSWEIDEVDLSLLHALQLAPRASWARLESVLEVDASTLSRRWANLNRAGLAWISVHPGVLLPWGSLAFIEVDCRSGSRDAVSAVLAHDPATWNIEYTTGRRDLFLTVGTRSLQELDAYVAERVATIPGVTATRTHFVRHIYREGSSWRLNALSSGQQRALSPDRSDQPAQFTEPTQFELSLLRALASDGRRTASSVATELGRSVSAVTRGIDRLVNTLHANMRCEIAHHVAGWGATANLYLSVPQDGLQFLADGLSSLSSVRLCAATTSPSNLLCQVWMHGIEELDEVEAYILHRCPAARVDDRWMVPRFAKRVGHLLDRHGRRTGCVVPEFASIAQAG